MPRHLKRFQESGNYHLITFSCDHRRPYLLEPGAFRTVEEIMEKMRARHSLAVHGYVLIPEHVHLLVEEPAETKLATVIGVIKQQSSRRLIGYRAAFWEERYHDVNLHTGKSATAALKYIHRNPVARGLVNEPHLWLWSSYQHYVTGLPGTVEVESWWTEMARKGRSELPAP